MEVTIMRYDSERLMIGKTVVDDRTFKCPSCPFEGGEDAMIDHAQMVGHVAVPASDPVPQRRATDHDHDVSRMDDEGCPNG